MNNALLGGGPETSQDNALQHFGRYFLDISNKLKNNTTFMVSHLSILHIVNRF